MPEFGLVFGSEAEAEVVNSQCFDSRPQTPFLDLGDSGPQGFCRRLSLLKIVLKFKTDFVIYSIGYSIETTLKQERRKKEYNPRVWSPTVHLHILLQSFASPLPPDRPSFSG